MARPRGSQFRIGGGKGGAPKRSSAPKAKRAPPPKGQILSAVSGDRGRAQVRMEGVKKPGKVRPAPQPTAAPTQFLSARQARRARLLEARRKQFQEEQEQSQAVARGIVLPIRVVNMAADGTSRDMSLSGTAFLPHNLYSLEGEDEFGQARLVLRDDAIVDCSEGVDVTVVNDGPPCTVVLFGARRDESMRVVETSLAAGETGVLSLKGEIHYVQLGYRPG